jgi:hypothetical protein
MEPSVQCYRDVRPLLSLLVFWLLHEYLRIVLLRHLSHNFPYDNIYSVFPLTVPEHSRARLIHLISLSMYDLDRPRRVQILKTKTAIRQVFKLSDKFPTVYSPALKFLTNGYGYDTHTLWRVTGGLTGKYKATCWVSTMKLSTS